MNAIDVDTNRQQNFGTRQPEKKILPDVRHGDNFRSYSNQATWKCHITNEKQTIAKSKSNCKQKCNV